jgi:hypothetical protein
MGVRHLAQDRAEGATDTGRTIPARLWTRDRFPVAGEAMLDLLGRLATEHPLLRDLGDLYRVRDTGLNYNRAAVARRILYEAPEREHPLDQARYRGRNFDRYGPISRGGWLRHDARQRLLPDERLYLDAATYALPEKIVFRQTADRMTATLDTTRMVMGRSVIAVTSVGNAPLLPLLACLNSRLFTALYRALAGEEGRILPQVKVGMVLALPVPRSCLPGAGADGAWGRAGENARALLACEARDRRLDAAVDRFVYELYGLSPAEIAEVEGCAGERLEEH